MFGCAYHSLLLYAVFYFAHSVPELLSAASPHADTMLPATQYHITNENQFRREYSVLFWVQCSICSTIVLGALAFRTIEQ